MPVFARLPEKIFTPNLFDAESLPKLVEPADLFVDIVSLSAALKVKKFTLKPHNNFVYVFKMLSEIKAFVKERKSDIILVIAVIMISLLSFALGFITASIKEKEPVRVETLNNN